MKKLVSIILAVAMMVTVLPMSAFAAVGEAIEESRALPDGAPRTAVFFEDVDASETVEELEAFYFGSQNMSISETDERAHIMKICRGGAAEGEASVVVKFINYSAVYGVNYRLSLIGSDAEPEIENGGYTLADFIAENSDSYEEIPLVDADELEDAGYVLSDEDTTDDFPGLFFTLDFEAGQKVRYIAVEALYEEGGDGNAMVSVMLKNPTGDMALLEEFTTSLVILNEDEPEDAVISIEEAEYNADEDTVTIGVVRTGALNELASVHLYTLDGTAVSGDDYSGCDVEVQFAFGIRKREVTLQVNHRYSDEEVDFLVRLGAPVGCIVGLDRAVVTIAPQADEDALLETQGDVDGTTFYPDNRLGSYHSFFDGFCIMQLYGNVYNRYNDIQTLTASTYDRDLNSFNGVYMYLGNPYAYDGYRVNMNSDGFYNPWTFCDILLGNPSRWYKDFAPQGQGIGTRFDVPLESPCAAYFAVGARLAQYRNVPSGLPRSAPQKVREDFRINYDGYWMVKRQFRFHLVQADPLSYLNTPSAVSDKYTMTYLPGVSSTQVDKSYITLMLDDSISVSCTGSEHEYAKLDSLGFYEDAACTRLIDVVYADNNTRTITKKLDESFFDRSFCDGLTYTAVSNGYIGDVYVKPHFTYYPCEITVETVDQVAIESLEPLYQTVSGKTVSRYHIGDSVKIHGIVPTQYQGIFLADGFNFQSRDGQGKLIVNGDVSYHFQDDTYTTYVTLETQKVTIKPEYRAADNSVVVKVKASEVNAGNFNTAVGLFVTGTRLADDGDYQCYRVSPVTVHTDELITMTAKTDINRYPVWTESITGKEFGGEFFVFSAHRMSSENVIYLSSRAVGSTDYVSFDMKGSLYAAGKNLASGISTTKAMVPMTDGTVVAGTVYGHGLNEPSVLAIAQSDIDGRFTISDLKGCNGMTNRMVIEAGGYEFIKEYKVPGDGALLDLGIIDCPVNTPERTYISSVNFIQNNLYVTQSEAITMNGKNVEIKVVVNDGNKYIEGTDVLTEKAKAVEILVIDGFYKTVKTVYPMTYSETEGAWTVKINNFAPDKPDEYTYGDVFYVRVITDRKSGDLTDDNGNLLDMFKETAYPMLSTGYEIVSSQDYKPLQIELKPPITADDLMGADENTIDATDDDGHTKEYARLPFVGAINSVIACTGPLLFTGGGDIPGLNDKDPDRYAPSSGTNHRVSVRITCYVQTLENNVNRFHIGVMLTMGNKAYDNLLSNPLEYMGLKMSAAQFNTNFNKSTAGKSGNLIANNPYGKGVKNIAGAGFADTMFTVSLMFGIYLDFGLILERDSRGEVVDRDFIFMGLGGYLGGSASVEKTFYCFPGYAGVELSICATVYFGATKDPAIQLKSDIMTQGNSVDDEGNPVVKLNDFHYNTAATIQGSVTGYAGVGYKHFIGARIYVRVEVIFSTSDTMMSFYPQLTDSYGVTLSAEIGGVIDLIVTSIPFKGCSIPAAAWGYAEYFRAVERTYIMNEMALKKLTENPGRYPQEAEIRSRLAYLMDLVDNDDHNGEIVSKYEETREWLYDGIGFFTTSEYIKMHLVTYNWTNLTAGEDEFSVHSRVASD